MNIMHSMSILVALETPSLITNSLASEAVVLPAGTLEDNTWWPDLQKCTTNTACMFLGDIVLISVTTTRVEGKEETSRQRQSRDSKWVLQLLRLEQLQEWNEMCSEKLSSSLQPSVVSASRGLKHSVRLSSNALVSRKGPFKRVHWALFKRASDCGWERVPLEFLVLSRDINAC